MLWFVFVRLIELWTLNFDWWYQSTRGSVLKTGPRVSRGFLYVSYPPRIELWTLDENSRKENEKECVKAVLYIVILEYSLYSKLSCCIRFIQVPFCQLWEKKKIPLWKRLVLLASRFRTKRSLSNQSLPYVVIHLGMG